MPFVSPFFIFKFMSKLICFNDLNYLHFITARTYKNAKYFRYNNNCLILINIIKKLRDKIKFKLIGYCIIPDHFHCLILPKLNSKYDISYIMMMIKGCSARFINLNKKFTPDGKFFASRG